MHLARRHAAAGLVLSCTAALASAQDLPLWEVGAFGVGVSQQAYPGSDQQVQRGLVLPYLIYRGKVLRADGETAGLRAFRTPQFELDVGVAASFGSRSKDIDARRGMPDLGTLVEFGPRLKWNLGELPGGGRLRLDLPLRGVFDLSDGAAQRGVAFEPELGYRVRGAGGWNWGVSVSAAVADRKLAQTFYGVEARYAQPGRAAYDAKSGLMAWRLAANASRQLTPDWRVFGFARVDTVAGAANEASPLVRKKVGATAGVGLSYTWLRSGEQAHD